MYFIHIIKVIVRINKEYKLFFMTFFKKKKKKKKKKKYLFLKKN